MIKENELEIGKLYILKSSEEYYYSSPFYIDEKLNKTNNFGGDFSKGQMVLILDKLKRNMGIYYKFLSFYNNRILYTSHEYINETSEYMHCLEIG